MSKLTDEAIDAAREVARKTFRRSQSQIRGQQITASDDPERHFARAIEAAATEPLLQRIAELEQRNSDLHEDVQRFKKHALNEKAARLELERQLEEARNRALEEAANGADALAKKWWARHCETNRHMETTREAHEDFCQLGRAIRALKGAKE